MQSRTSRAFDYWLAHGAPGSRFVYYTGFLGRDRFVVNWRDGRPHVRLVEPLHSLALKVMDACEQGYVTLVQHRIAPEVFEYIAVRKEQQT